MQYVRRTYNQKNWRKVWRWPCFCTFFAYLNVCRWIAVIDCRSRLQSKQKPRLNNKKKKTEEKKKRWKIRRPVSLPKWMEEIELTTNAVRKSYGTITSRKPITIQTHESWTIWRNPQAFFFIPNMLSTNGSYSLYHLNDFA